MSEQTGPIVGLIGPAFPLDFVKKLLQNEPFRFLPKPFCSLVMKTKRTLPPTKVGARRPRRNFERSQKEDRDAIDAAFKRNEVNFRYKAIPELLEKKVDNFVLPEVVSSISIVPYRH